MSGRSGDGWVFGPGGERYWGRFGAAGLLLMDAERSVLMQHRVAWSHFGGTWALPGGARHEGESAVEAAVREAGEEAGVAAGAVEVRFEHVLDLGYWSYTTVGAVARGEVRAAVTDPESIEVAWVPIDEVAALPLHPRFAEAWPGLKARLDVTAA
ncbi:NUDIX hydrolase [Agromyces archimandritae]